MKQKSGSFKRKPEWLKVKIPSGDQFLRVKNIIDTHHLHTICTSGECPNQGECWERGTATFMILGDICTRSCKFCATKSGKPLPVEPEEPENLAHAVQLLKLNHCVITSVDRDDLEDGGASVWAETVRQVKYYNPGVTIETLIPDFKGDKKDIQKVINAEPEVISHNLETVRRLTPKIRSHANYDTSLKVIETVAESGITAKSGIMVGLGETEPEVFEAMDDLLEVGCKVMTIGQYLQPTRQQLPVYDYITPSQFKKFKNIGLEKGFEIVESGPLVRSSYHAERHVL